jgi:hypothetical protein
MKQHTIQIATVLALLASSAVSAQQAVQWRVSDGGNGHWYQTVHLPTPCAFDSAARIARSVGGHLATISTEAELNLVGSFGRPRWAWTGGVVQNSGCYHGSGCSIPCVGGEPTWESGEPWYAPLGDYVNCWGGGRYGLAAANGGFLWATVWVAEFVNEIDSLIVEWDTDCNADGIVDYGQCHNGTLPDYNGNNVPDCCERSETCVVGHYPVQWRSEDGGNGHWYKRNSIPDGGSFDSIRQLATASGGDLASIHSAAQDRFVQSIAMPYSWNNGALIGTRTPPGCTNFAWSDGTPWDFTNWGSGQPNCKIGDGVGYYEDGWHDLYDFDVASFITEWSADCNNDGVIDYGQILQGHLADTNTDGVPDVCQCATNPSLPACCPGDLDHDATVGGADIGLLLSNWGPCGSACLYDLNNDGKVNGGDLGLLLAAWGPCSG